MSNYSQVTIVNGISERTEIFTNDFNEVIKGIVSGERVIAEMLQSLYFDNHIIGTLSEFMVNFDPIACRGVKPANIKQNTKRLLSRNAQDFLKIEGKFLNFDKNDAEVLDVPAGREVNPATGILRPIPKQKDTEPKPVVNDNQHNPEVTQTRTDDTIDALQDDISALDKSLADEQEKAVSLEDENAELRAELERVKKDNTLTYEKYNVVVEAIHSNITRKELRAMVS